MASPVLFAHVLFAQGVNLDLLVATLALLGTIFLGVLAIVWFNRWRNRPLETTPLQDQAKSFRALYEEGLLSEEEYEKIRAQLARKAAAAPASPPASPDNPL